MLSLSKYEQNLMKEIDALPFVKLRASWLRMTISFYYAPSAPSLRALRLIQNFRIFAIKDEK